MIRFLIIPVIALPVLAIGLAAPQIAHAQAEIESLLDSAPGLGPRDRDRRDGTRRNDDPRLDEGLDRLDRHDRDGRRNDRDRTRPDDLDFEDDDDLPPRRRDEPEDPTFKKADPGLGHKVIAGSWTGTVEEVGKDPYTLRLSLKEDGTGTAAYSGLDCSSDVVPIAGRLLEYRETITQGREKCDDGIVQLRLRRGLLLWTWKDDQGEVRAAATLRRSTEAASETAAADLVEEDDDQDPRHAGDGVVTLPPEEMEVVVD